MLIESGKFDVNYQKTLCTYYDEHEEWESVNEESKTSPLHIAILRKHTDIAEFLLSCSDIDINAHYSYEKCTAIFNHWKVWSDTRAEGFEDKLKIDSTKNLRRYGFEKWEKTPLHLAIDNNNTKIAEILISNEKIDVNTPFEKFRQSYDLASEEYKGMDDESVTQMPILFYAVEKNNLNIVILLLSNVNVDINSPIIISKNPCQFEIKDYVEEEPQIENETKPIGEKMTFKNSPLGYALQNDKKDIINLLLTNEKIDVNQKTEKRISPPDCKY